MLHYDAIPVYKASHLAGTTRFIIGSLSYSQGLIVKFHTSLLLQNNCLKIVSGISWRNRFYNFVQVFIGLASDTKFCIQEFSDFKIWQRLNRSH